MQTIDVLGNDGLHFPRSFQPDNGMMHYIGSRATEGIPAFQFVIPMFDPCCFRTHEIVEINGLTPGPDTLRTAKIRNPTVRRNAGSSENQSVLSNAKVIGEGHSVVLIHAQACIYRFALSQTFLACGELSDIVLLQLSTMS